MKDTELAQLLRQRYDSAKRNETACQVHLFGIQYVDALQHCGCPLKQVLALSGVPMGYLSELSKGMKLAQYVQLRERGEEDG